LRNGLVADASPPIGFCEYDAQALRYTELDRGVPGFLRVSISKFQQMRFHHTLLAGTRGNVCHLEAPAKLIKSARSAPKIV